MYSWNNLAGKRVRVQTTCATFEGVLVEMNETAVLLRADTGHREVDMSQVIRMEEVSGQVVGILSPSPFEKLK